MHGGRSRDVRASLGATASAQAEAMLEPIHRGLRREVTPFVGEPWDELLRRQARVAAGRHHGHDARLARRRTARWRLHGDGPAASVVAVGTSSPAFDRAQGNADDRDTPPGGRATGLRLGDEREDHFSLPSSVSSSSTPNADLEFFFENEQRRRLGESLLLACQLALEPADAVRHRLGRPALLVEREAPLFELGQAHTVLLQERGELLAGERQPRRRGS